MGWLIGGGLLGYGLARWNNPESDLALIVSVLAFPFSVFFGWLLMLLAAIVYLPFTLPRILRRLRNPSSRPVIPPAEQRRRMRRLGWAFVLTAAPFALFAGLFAGAPLIYLLAGIAYGLGLRGSPAMYEVELEA